MKFGLTLPIVDELADPGLLAQLAVEAETAGWDGVFVWDHVYYREPVKAVTDPWIALAAIAVNTSSVVLGPMVTPLARRRPHVVARQVAALDQLSQGRVIFGTGLGLDASGGEFTRFGEVTDLKQRATMYDEALTLIRALLSGGRVDHDGQYFKASAVSFMPRPVQPELPIWTAARWPHRRPLDRAARNQGVFIIDLPEPTDLAAACSYLEERRSRGLHGFDVVVHGPAGSDPGPWKAAGATWWLAAFDPMTATAEAVRAAIEKKVDA
jgi:alkanesulfonate monooxygenase SsuD/methylene tetrahydromethanopterin reductase-like flavin-dependent oxidoreductase (luciferase family)